VAGTAYTGPVAGLSIPLWANSNKVRMELKNEFHKALAALLDHRLIK